MDPLDILKRSFRITRTHRALWVFGILLALTAGGSGFSGSGYNFNVGDWGRRSDAGVRLPDFPEPVFSTGILAFLIGLACLILILAVVGVIVRYVSETGIYRLVDELEEGGTKPVTRRGFRLGWDRRAFRMFLIDLVIGIPFTVAVILLFLFALSPLLLLMIDNTAVRVVSVIFTVILVLAAILVLIVTALAVSLLSQFWHREAAIGGKGVLDAIREGTALVRANLSNAIVMYLVMIGVGIGWGIVLIPVFLVVAALALLFGGLPAFLIYQATQSLAVPLVVGILIGLVVLFVPLVFLGGLYTTFATTVWTLTYRDLRARLRSAPAVPPSGPAGDLLKLAEGPTA
ncbi:MAG: hypothetical protein IT330_12990 [Anaerolineae bacterium]|nr:hypothetical protein [Anaerolineae bacterium]